MSSVESVSKQERAYTILRERILDGTYSPGYRLVIDSLAPELDVSPMPVREAVRRLEAEGWVVYQRNRGAQVAPVDANSWVEATVCLAVLEGYATALAAPDIRADDLREMREHNARMEQALEAIDLMKVTQHNQAFHEAIYERCPNAHLRRELASLWERLNTLRGTIFAVIPTRGQVSVREHEELLAMIESGRDAPAIERYAREHKMHTVTAFREHQEGG